MNIEIRVADSRFFKVLIGRLQSSPPDQVELPPKLLEEYAKTKLCYMCAGYGDNDMEPPVLIETLLRTGIVKIKGERLDTEAPLGSALRENEDADQLEPLASESDAMNVEGLAERNGRAQNESAIHIGEPVRTAPKNQKPHNFHELALHHPISYLSEKKNEWCTGRFIRVVASGKNKGKVMIKSAECKVNFCLPVRLCRIIDTSPLSQVPVVL